MLTKKKTTDESYTNTNKFSQVQLVRLVSKKSINNPNVLIWVEKHKRNSLASFFCVLRFTYSDLKCSDALPLCEQRLERKHEKKSGHPESRGLMTQRLLSV